MSQAALNEDRLIQADFDPGLTPPEIVRELDRYVIAQDEAKKAVAIALRNRWRRLRVPSPMQEEISPKNIIMIGPTGVGKTEISRRLAKLSGAPFVKVEASKFTEVGYVGRDVDSIVRDLIDISINMVRDEERKAVRERAEQIAEDKLLDLLLPGTSERPVSEDVGSATGDLESSATTREKFRRLLRDGKLEERTVEIEVVKTIGAQMQILGPQGFAEIEGQLQEMFSNAIPKKKETKLLSVSDAREHLIKETQESLINNERVIDLAKHRAEETGIVFIDEIDKVCGSVGGKGPDVSREGVQRDLLPLVEGCTVNTKYGPVKTDHILFIASGAFHIAKPSDLMPEFQGRFPIRVELKSLTPEHFVRILTEPENALTRQYYELLKTEGVEIEFTRDGIEELSSLTAQVNSGTEDIGARRLHTLLEKVLEEVLFNAHNLKGSKVVIDRNYVSTRLRGLVNDPDLARFIL